MKISIDTKEDSIEDIRKVVALLSGIIGKKEERHTNNINIFSDEKSSTPEMKSEPMNVFASMFGANDAENTIEKKEEKAEEKKEERFEIMPY